MAPQLTISLLGAFRVEVDGRLVPASAWNHRRAADLVKLLALAPRTRMTREELIEAMWPGSAPARGASNLRKAVHFARRALGSEAAIEVDSGTVGLAARPDVDIRRFEEAAEEALRSPTHEACAAAESAYAGDLLPEDAYAPWVDEPRRRLRRLHLAVLKAGGSWQRVLELEPLDEEAHREMMLRDLEVGNRGGAIRQFEQLRQALAQELGLEPGKETVAIYRRALSPDGGESPTPAERARALLAWAAVHWERRDLAEAEGAARQARALAVDAGLGAELGEASALLGVIFQARGVWREFLQDELVQSVAATPRLAPFVFDANLCLGQFCLDLPDGLDGMTAFAAGLAKASAASGSDQGLALATLIRGEVALLSGRLSEAADLLAEAVEQHRDAGSPAGLALALSRLAEAETRLGRRWLARRRLEPALRVAEATPLAPHVVVRVLGAGVEAARDVEEAVARVEEAEATLEGVEVCDSCSMGFRIAAAMATGRAGDSARAERHLAEAERIAPMWHGGPWQAAVRAVHGVLAHARGDEELGRRLLGEAADMFLASGRPVEARRCRRAGLGG